MVVANVPVVGNPDTPPDELRPMIPRRTEALVFVSSVNDASMRALNYARSLRCAAARAVYFALDPEEASRSSDSGRSSVAVELDIVEAPFRELDAPISRRSDA